MEFIFILVTVVPYLALAYCLMNRRLSNWWISHKLFGSLAIVVAIVTFRMVLFFEIPKLTGASTIIGDLGLPFMAVGLFELIALEEIGAAITGFHAKFEILDNLVLLAMTDLILLLPIFLAVSFIVGASRHRKGVKGKESKEKVSDPA